MPAETLFNPFFFSVVVVVTRSRHYAIIPFHGQL